MRRVLSVAVVYVMTLLPALASAQEPRRFGILFGVPTNVGASWRVARRFTIRSDVAFSWTDQELTSETRFPVDFFGREVVTRSTTEISSTNVSVGIGGFFTLATWDTVHAYGGPRLSVTRTSTTSVATFDPLPQTNPPTVIFSPGTPDGGNDSRSEVNYAASVLFGTQYTPLDRLAIFGEAGVTLPVSNTTITESSTSHRRTMSTTGRVGVILFLK